MGGSQLDGSWLGGRQLDGRYWDGRWLSSRLLDDGLLDGRWLDGGRLDGRRLDVLIGILRQRVTACAEGTETMPSPCRPGTFVALHFNTKCSLSSCFRRSGRKLALDPWGWLDLVWLTLLESHHLVEAFHKPFAHFQRAQGTPAGDSFPPQTLKTNKSHGICDGVKSAAPIVHLFLYKDRRLSLRVWDRPARNL